MSNYLNESNSVTVPSNKSPIVPKEEKWEVSNKKLQRVFSFSSRKQKEAFVVEVMKYIRESDADIEVRLRKNKVGVIIYSLSPSLSEIEFEAKVDINKIKKDVAYYFAKEK